MVRETRHLWVGNLPDNVREDRIREHFKRYGRVQNVKLLGRTESPGPGAAGSTGSCATVAFMDIKSASKAHNGEHVLDERTLTTEYYEPAAIPTVAGAPSAGSSPAGSGYSGSSCSVNSAPAAPAPVPAPAQQPPARYHPAGEEPCPLAASAAAPVTWRGTNDSATEYCRRGSTPASYTRFPRATGGPAPYSTPPSNADRTPHQRWYESAPSTPGVEGGEGLEGGSGAEGGAGGGADVRRRSGSSRSSRSSSSSERSSGSRASTPAAPPPSTPAHLALCGRPLAICVRNLPARSSDSSLKDGLYHEYKKHGKVVWVKVVGQNSDRYAVVRFKKPSDVEKALEVSQDKLFFGCKISVAPHQSCDEDAESAKPYETDIDEYHPKATRTLFIGNLEKEVTQQHLRDKFKKFGRIMEIDIKKGSGGGVGYAFCQYASISSVVDAIKAMDGEYIGNSRVKLGFGKPVATTCVWVDGLTEATEKQVLSAVSRCGAATSVCVDRAAGAALVHFEQAAAASAAVRDLRRHAAATADTEQRRLMVDYASRECQEAFYEQLEKHGGTVPPPVVERLSGELSTRYLPPTRHDTIRYEGISRGRSSSYSRSTSRTQRYSTIEHFDPHEYSTDRRYRVYEELGSSPQPEEPLYEERLPSVVVSSPHRTRRHRRDSTPEEHKHSKERHRGNGGGRRCSGEVRHRSRSGSRSEHRERKRHRRRRDDESGSRAGTPLFDELPEGPLPSEPRRPPLPRDRSHLPMSLPLPKFAAQLLRVNNSNAPMLTPSAAPASPSRPPSASSSSGGSAPHSPSLEERIRSLDEKYEKWNGSRVAAAEAAERGRFRHRLLELDINEVKPSDVVRSLLAKRSIFDEDSERLEGTVLQRPPSPGGSPRTRSTPRALQYPFPTHPPATLNSHAPDSSTEAEDRLPINGFCAKIIRDHQIDRKTDSKLLENLDNNIDINNRINFRTIHGQDANLSVSDPRLNRIDKLILPDNVTKISDNDANFEALKIPDSGDKPLLNKNCIDQDRDPRRENDRKRYEFLCNKDAKEKIICKKDDNNEIDKQPNIGTEKIEKAPDSCKVDLLTDCIDRKQVTDLRHTRRNSASVEGESKDYLKSLDSININKTINISHEKGLSSDNQTLDNFEDINKKHEKLNTIVNSDKLKIHNKTTDQDARNYNKHSPQVLNCHEKLKDEDATTTTEECRKDKKIFDNLKSPNPIVTMSAQTSLDNSDIKINDHNERNNSHKDENNSDKQKNESKKYIKNKTNDTGILFDKTFPINDKDYNATDRLENDRLKSSKDKADKDKHESTKVDKSKSSKIDHDKFERDKKSEKLVHSDRGRSDRDKEHTKCSTEKVLKDREEKPKISDDKGSRSYEHKKDKKKETSENIDTTRHNKKDERHRHDKHRKEHNDVRRDSKKDHDTKSRKSSRDESSRDLCRKDSTDSTASRTSHDSSKTKDVDGQELKDEIKAKTNKHHLDHQIKQKSDKESSSKESSKFVDHFKNEDLFKIKEDNEHTLKNKVDIMDKPRHYSVDSASVENKRKERLNSCSSLPSNIGHKRRMSSQDSTDSLCENKKCKPESKAPERRDSKDSKYGEKSKIPKFNKGHFAKLIESKTKDDKKNQVKPPDDMPIDWRSTDTKDYKINDKIKALKRSPRDTIIEDKTSSSLESAKSDELQDHLEFLATLELRSSEEDEKQKALKKEMKEKKRIQQLQQIHELQMQQDALQLSKDDRKNKIEDKKKDICREKRMSIDRKSRDEKPENRRKSRKQIQSTDTSDSDEPKKHSIFDIIDDEPTYISMYDKVKARSCKNMQKQEEEKRQEKIKAKFSQLKQSRAKREEKKRSSWDEDSDSEHERKKSQKNAMRSCSSDDEHTMSNKKQDKNHIHNCHSNDSNISEFCNVSNLDEESRNKLSRKNSRTRIISDTSDEEMSNSYTNIMKKELLSHIENHLDLKHRDFFIDNIKKEDIDNDREENDVKNMSLELYHCKSESRDNVKIESTQYDNYKDILSKVNNDLSSENESSSRYPDEQRRKHKRKLKKKLSNSDDETKVEMPDLLLDNKHKHNSDKIRKHNNRKEKRKDKIRVSTDIDDDKHKYKKNRSLSISQDNRIEAHIKKEGKMEDIFGPLSDESDSSSRLFGNHNIEFKPVNHNKEQYDTSNDETKLKEEFRRKKEKKRKEKRQMFRDDENSLDVDAVGKAIEARLFADSFSDENNCLGSEAVTNIGIKQDQILYKYSSGISSDVYLNKHNDRNRKDSKERRKKKKRNKDERQKHAHHHKFDNFEISVVDTTEPIQTIEIPNCVDAIDTTDLTKSHSLPRLTDSPPLSKLPQNETENTKIVIDDVVTNDSIDTNKKETKEEVVQNMDQCHSDNNSNATMELEIKTSVSTNINYPTPSESTVISSGPTLDSVADKIVSEDAVRSISDFENADKNVDNLNIQKLDDKVEEKPRAMISQEETEDAVAALLGESFRGNEKTFGYDEEQDQTQTIIENTTIDNEVIPEEDAEEMRQAVQNLNASEMEIKPETPVSDNDLLLIDTDAEETEDSQQSINDKQAISTSMSQTTTSQQSANDKPLISTSISHITTATSQSEKGADMTGIVISKPKQITTAVQSLVSDVDSNKSNDIKLPIIKRENLHQITSSATPVITSWTMTNNKLRESRVLNIQKTALTTAMTSENKPPLITTNIVQLKTPATVQLNNPPSRTIIGAPNRMNAPYQVVNNIGRPGQISNMQPPTIKIPDQQIIYQKPQGIVISPRIANDVRLQSPKAGTHEGMTSPRISNMTILSTSPQSMNPVNITSPTIQRSPGQQVTVVRMQQPPLSPIQTVHLPHGGRAMVSPNRTNSVLVQTQSSPLQFNRLPVTPVLAPLSKQLNPNSMVQQNKGLNVSTSLVHQQKILTGDIRKPEQRSDNMETPKVILPTTLQHSTNPTVMAQNRLISMQNAVHVGNLNSGLHITNKVLINNVSRGTDKREVSTLPFKSDHMKTPDQLGQSPIIHVTNVNHTTASIIQNNVKVSQELTRPQHIPNVIHTLNSQRLLTTTPIANVIHLDANKTSSVFSTIRHPTVLTKLDTSNSTVPTTTTLGNVVMTPLLLKTTGTNTARPVKFVENMEMNLQNRKVFLDTDKKSEDSKQMPGMLYAPVDKRKELYIKQSEVISKCETDFEELLKDNTNEIKVINDPTKKLEVNVGKSITHFSQVTHNNKESCIDTVPSSIVHTDSSSLAYSKSQEVEYKPCQDEGLKTSLDNKPTIICNNLDEAESDQKIPPEINTEQTSTKLSNNGDVSSDDYEKCNEPNVKAVSESNVISEKINWSANDLNIGSVIKKVDSMCSDTIADKENEVECNDIKNEVVLKHCEVPEKPSNEIIKQQETEKTQTNFDENFIEKSPNTATKRGGRGVRGKRSEKTSERIQTRQVSKSPRGGGVSKRGRGRGRVDKKLKNAINVSPNNIPGDVYDFHEDSGDESTTSPSKSEARPRLILTIKSPLGGNANATATSTLSISSSPFVSKDDKEEKEDFISPSSNTRKSRRLQEKDKSNTTDDVIDDVKNSPIQTRNSKDVKKRATRQTNAKLNNQEKTTLSDVRKSPRGVKRTKNRSISDASLDSSDEKVVKKDEAPRDPKVPKLADSVVISTKSEPDHSTETKTNTNAATVVTSVAIVVPSTPVTPSTPTPIMKPPKKMISEISAKLGTAIFESTTSTTPSFKTTISPIISEKSTDDSTGKSIVDIESQHFIRDYRDRNPDCAKAPPEEVSPAATAEPTEPHGNDSAFVRRIMDSVPGNVMPVGVMEAADARVQSPALPHRPPSIHRPADRATPVLVRGIDGEGSAASSRAYRAPYAGTASLPRGAHHPPPPHSGHPALPVHPAHPAHPAHPHLKPLAAGHQLQPHPGSTARVTITSIPTGNPQGHISMGDGMYPHFSHQNYQMYQQHFRATQHDGRATSSSPYTRAMEAEGSEAPTPPLELRRPPSARVPRPAHSPSPTDRLIRCRSPPPAHAHAGMSRMPSALPPPGPSGPPHASQVPREADSLQMLLRRYPVMWQGLLALKNDCAAVQMHFVHGNHTVASNTLPRHMDASSPLLRIAQRMRLEPTQLDQVHRKMKQENEHCMLLALPCGRDHMDVLQQSTNLSSGFITYLQRKQAAGIVNVAPPGHQQAMYTVHIFPSCDFANENLNRIAPDLMHRVADIAHLLIVIATV